LFFGLGVTLRFGEGIQLRRVEINEVNAGVGKNPPVPHGAAFRDGLGVVNIYT
jgi:hypothetical protein